MARTDTNKFYDKFYHRGGWTYDPKKEIPFLRDLVVGPAGWRDGARVLELGCGRGEHAAMLDRLGLDMDAVDLSPVGIQAAQSNFDGPRYIAADVTTWNPDDDYDGIFVRGLSVYHYELDGVNKIGMDVPKLTERFFGWLRPGGVFVLQIATDFSGRRPDTLVHFSKRSAYEYLFRPFGKVFRTTDWQGRKLVNDTHAQAKGKGGILIFTRKS